ncbi:MAG: hypothetical protein EA378_09780 [Phycisphaerales bacterium]|nr:MAG: hypothetical protein EA378_09780 [Phycisphaerales bacterium]
MLEPENHRKASRPRVGAKEYTLTIAAIAAGVISSLLHAGVIEFPQAWKPAPPEHEPLPEWIDDDAPEPDPRDISGL